MARFEPNPGDAISWNGSSYEVMEHPAAPGIAFAQTGRKATVYQLKKSDGQRYALKIFKPAFRDPSLVDICDKLSQLTWPGLEACQRTCLTSRSADGLISKYPEMEYAILMPWIEGSTWHDMLFSKTELSLEASKELAKNMAQVLASLEQAGLAHCDISGANVIVNTNRGTVHLIDVEDMFGVNWAAPTGFPQGTDGYQHRTSRTAPQGQWCLEGDRFSGAILLAEIVTWHEQQIRDASDETTYFAENELQDPYCARYERMVGALYRVSPDIANYFMRAWDAPTLNDCPPLSQWARWLSFPMISKWMPISAPPPRLPPSGVATPVFLLNPPTLHDITAVGVDQPCLIEWSRVQNATDYELQVAESDLSYQHNLFSRLYKGPDKAHFLTYDSIGTRYYRVRALNKNQESAWSEPKAVTIRALVPTMPTLNNITLQKGALTISWSRAPHANWYELQEAKEDHFAKTYQHVTIPTRHDDRTRIRATQIMHPKPAPGRYAYRVRACNEHGCSQYSAEQWLRINEIPTPPAIPATPPAIPATPPAIRSQSATPAAILPPAPTLYAIEDHQGRDCYMVAWSGVPGATGYLLCEAPTPDFREQQLFDQGRARCMHWRDKEPGTYYYRVFAYNQQGQYDRQNPSPTVSTKVILEPPTWLPPYVLENQEAFIRIRLRWEKTKAAAKYELLHVGTKQRFESPEISWKFKVTQEETHQFRLRAISRHNIPSDWNPTREIRVSRRMPSKKLYCDYS